MTKKKKTLMQAVRLSLAILFAAIAWTNESIDYLGKIGIHNVNSGWVLLVTTFLFAVFLIWFLLELKKGKKR